MSYKEGGLIKDKYLIYKLNPIVSEAFVRVDCRYDHDAYRMLKHIPVALVDPEAQYFVLRVDKDLHARKALLAYADSVKDDNQAFAFELVAWLDELNDQRPDWLRNSKVIWQEDDARPIDAETLNEAWKRLVSSLDINDWKSDYEDGDFFAYLHVDGWIHVISCEGSEIRKVKDVCPPCAGTGKVAFENCGEGVELGECHDCKGTGYVQ